MAAGEFEGAGVSSVAAEGVEHLSGELGEHGGVVFAVDHEAGTASAHATLDVGHGANGGPVVAKFVDGNVTFETFPDVVGGHALADDVGVVGGDVEETTGADGFIMDEGDVADGGTETGAEDAELGVALLFEPAKTAAGVLDGLAVGLEGHANVWAADLIGAFVALDHTAVVVGHAHFENSDAHALNPVAEAVLAMPFGVPIGEKENGGAGARVVRVEPRWDRLASGKKLGVDEVVFRPRGDNGAREGKDVFAIKAIVAGRSGGEPIFAGFDGVLGVIAQEGAGVWIIGGTADVFEAPVEGLDAAIVVGCPAAVLVASDFAFEPVHSGSYQLSVYVSLQLSVGEDKNRSERESNERKEKR